ncbi:MAG: ROK family protein [Anaplasmataceae bacterium]|nr:ROK family protein [Anaplasmataceae bacterium]
MRIDVSHSGNLSTQPKIFPTPQSFEKGIDLIEDTLQKIGSGSKVSTVAVGIAGTLNKDKTRLFTSPHLEGWVGKPLKEKLENIIKAPTYLENDAALVGLGEAIAGAGKNKNIVAYLTVNTGFGGVRIVNGKIDHNALGFEPGKQVIATASQPFETPFTTTNLENIISGKALEKRFGQESKFIKDMTIWEEVDRWIALAVLNTIYYWSPEIVVIGGSVTHNLSMETIHRFVRENLTTTEEVPEIVRAELGESGGLYGGLELIRIHSS